MGKVMLEGYKCERCGHTWIPRVKIEESPTICPKCKSPYWNKPRKSESLSKQIAGKKLSQATERWNQKRGRKT